MAAAAGERRGRISGPVAVQVMRIGVYDGVLRWRSARAILHRRADPDVLARRLAGVEQPADGLALHSTSWHHADGRVVLTYAVFPDPAADADWEPLAQLLAVGAGPVDPSPVLLDRCHVAAHADRHLADLAGGRDPYLSACARQRPDVWRLLAEHARGVRVGQRDVNHGTPVALATWMQ